MSTYTTAANWLGNIVGTNPNNQVVQHDDHKDPVVRDLRDICEEETKHMQHAQAPRYDSKGVNNNQANGPGINGRAYFQQQPKPKFVAHKEPKKGKDKGSKSSDRLGGNHMA